MRARLVWIAELIESVGLPNVNSGTSEIPGAALGDAPEGENRHCTRALRHGVGAAVVIVRACLRRPRRRHGRDQASAATGKGTEPMTKISDLHRCWSKDADYKDAYDSIGEEFVLFSNRSRRAEYWLDESRLAK
jgi:hypothetical protein